MPKHAKACSRAGSKQLFVGFSSVFLAKRLRNIIKVFTCYEDVKQIHLVMECCEGGELFDAIIEQGKMSESDAARGS